MFIITHLVCSVVEMSRLVCRTHSPPNHGPGELFPGKSDTSVEFLRSSLLRWEKGTFVQKALKQFKNEKRLGVSQITDKSTEWKLSSDTAIRPSPALWFNGIIDTPLLRKGKRVNSHLTRVFSSVGYIAVINRSTAFLTIARTPLLIAVWILAPLTQVGRVWHHQL